MLKVKHLLLPTLMFSFAAVMVIMYTLGASEVIKLFASASLLFIGCYLITSLLIAMVLTFKWQIILRAKKAKVPYWRLFSYRLVGYSVSYLTPTAHVGGEPVRAYLLKKEGVHINTAFSTVIIDKSIEIFADCIFFFLGVLLIINSVEVESSMKIVLLSVSLILIMLTAMFIAGILHKRSMFVAIFRFLRLHRMRRLRPVEKNLTHIEREVEHFYRREKRHFLIIVLLMMLLWVLMFLEYRFALLIFGHVATPLQIFLILTGVGFAYSFPIPAAMGILELGQLSAAKVLNLSSATGLALALLVRSRDLIWTVIGLSYLAVYEFSFSKLSKQTRQIDEEFEKGDLFRKR